MTDDIETLREFIRYARPAYKGEEALAALERVAQWNEAFKFRIGEPVRKPSGYAFDGTVRSAFMVSGGDRYVVESEAAPGLLHIFNGSQLERKS